MVIDMKKIVALSILTLCLTTSQAHAGKIKKALEPNAFFS